MAARKPPAKPAARNTAVKPTLAPKPKFTSEDPEKRARQLANLEKGRAKKGEQRARKYGTDADIDTLVLDNGQTVQDVYEHLRSVRDTEGSVSQTFNIAFDHLARTYHRHRYLDDQGDGLSAAATAEKLELSRSLAKQMNSLLLTPEAQIKAGLPERKAAAEREKLAERARSRTPEVQQEQFINNLPLLKPYGFFEGLYLLRDEDVDGEDPTNAIPRIQALIREGRIPGAYIDDVPVVPHGKGLVH